VKYELLVTAEVSYTNLCTGLKTVSDNLHTCAGFTALYKDVIIFIEKLMKTEYPHATKLAMTHIVLHVIS
jgi:hypothetical protein